MDLRMKARRQGFLQDSPHCCQLKLFGLWVMQCYLVTSRNVIQVQRLHFQVIHNIKESSGINYDQF